MFPVQMSRPLPLSSLPLTMVTCPCLDANGILVIWLSPLRVCLVPTPWEVMMSDILAGLLMTLYRLVLPRCKLLLPVNVLMVTACRVLVPIGVSLLTVLLFTFSTPFPGLQLALASRILLSGAMTCLMATLPCASALAPLE